MMESATCDLHCQRITEMIHDEEMIVTCPSIAAELKLSINDAKHLLQMYAKDFQNEKAELSITHMIAGSYKNGKGFGVHLVKDEDLHKEKRLFDTISSELVYSIQKSKPIDFNVIALTYPACDSWQGAIIGHNCTKREIPKKVPENRISNKPVAASSKQNVEHQTTKQEVPQSQKKETKSKQNGGIANFLSKMQPKTSVKSTSSHPSKPAPQIDAEIKVTQPKNNVSEENKTDNVALNKDSIKEDVKTKPKSETESRKRKKKNKANVTNKRHKRIQEICDSDSSDIFEDDENEDVIEKSDEEVLEAPVIKSAPPPPKNKKRKAVDKTYVDEEGFIVTTTEYIYESASEDESKDNQKEKGEEKTKVLVEKKVDQGLQNNKKIAGNKAKTNKKPISGKQSTIMNFFKKS